MVVTLLTVKTVGTRREVFDGHAKRTSGGMTADDIAETKDGRLVAKSRQRAARENPALAFNAKLVKHLMVSGLAKDDIVEKENGKFVAKNSLAGTSTRKVKTQTPKTVSGGNRHKHSKSPAHKSINKNAKFPRGGHTVHKDSRPIDSFITKEQRSAKMKSGSKVNVEDQPPPTGAFMFGW
jgi:hypothetical protein